MKLNALRDFFRQWVVLLIIGFVLAGCGGGGGGTTTSGTSGAVATPNGSISVSLASSTGVSTNVIPANGSLVATAKVLNASGSPVQNSLVTFTVSNNVVATLLPASGTALTNSSGIAVVTLVGGSGGGAASITVSATPVTSTAVTSTTNFTATVATTPSTGSLSVYLTTASALPASTIPTSGNLIVNALALDGSGNPISNAKVLFSVDLSTVGVLSPAIGTALTNSAGLAQIVLNSSTSAGAATVTASTTFPGTTTTVSGSVNFSSGGPTTISSPTVKLALLNSSNASVTAISTSSVYTVVATVTDSSGKPLPNLLVNFSSTATLTSLTPSAATALTNSSGIATIIIAPLNLSTAIAQTGAAGIITAATTVSGQAISSSIPFTMGNTTISLQLVSPLVATAVNAYASLPIQVSVLSNGLPYTAQPVVVNFSSGCATSGKATLPASASTVNGVAQVTYTDKGCSATDTVTASVAGAQSVAATLNVAAPTAASIGFTSASPSDKSIVINNSGGFGRSQTAVLTFTVFDNNGNGLANQLVTFSVNNGNTIVTLNTPSGTTGATGTVQATVNSLSTAGTFRVIASVTNGSIVETAISDTVTVTTGQPVQAAFSLSAASYNIEGWVHDGVTDTLTALIADINGNPVADGTPVVATTDSGAVGSSSLGGCVTVNGACTVQFRSQSPRYTVTGNGVRAGMATVKFSSSNQTTIALSGTVPLFLSDSVPTHFYVNNVEVFNGQVFTTNTCSFGLQLEIDDLNYNPMPSGTTIAAINAVGVNPGTVYPTLVPNVPPWSTILTDSATTHYGSVHYIPLQVPATSCNVGGSGTFVSTFSVTVTTPLGTGRLINFVLHSPI